MTNEKKERTPITIRRDLPTVKEEKMETFMMASESSDGAMKSAENIHARLVQLRMSETFFLRIKAIVRHLNMNADIRAKTMTQQQLIMNIIAPEIDRMFQEYGLDRQGRQNFL